jgi:hypothetical protein
VTDPVRVSVYIDPSCPWTWITAGWLREVAPQRRLMLRWRSLSLVQRDGTGLPPAMPEHSRALASAASIQSHRLLRVFEALRALPGGQNRRAVPEVGRAAVRPAGALRYARSEFNWFLHLVVPAVGILVFLSARFTALGIGKSALKFFPPLSYPVSETGLIIGSWYAIGVVVLIYLYVRRPSRLLKMQQVFSDAAVPAAAGSLAGQEGA